jgi:hypothetical protein
VLNYKKYSKIRIAVAIIMVLVLTVGFMFNNAISADNSQKEDFKYATEFLDKLNFLVEGDISEENVTRGEIAFFVASLRNPDTRNLFYEGDLVETLVWGDFGTDGVLVEETAKYGTRREINYDKKDYGKAVEQCVEDDIMFPDWFSKPEKTVTLGDAVEMLITALKYEVGDGNYIAKALTKQVRLLGEYAVFPFAGTSADKILTKNDAVMLVYNCMMSEYATDFETGAKMVWNAETHRIEAQPQKFRAVMNTFGLFVANPMKSKVTVNGKEISFNAYNIDGSNYFKLRDLGYTLNGTEKQFDVDYQNNATTLYNATLFLRVGKSYETVGGEMAEKSTYSMTALNVACAVNLWNIETNRNTPVMHFAIYSINGEDYYKLRDIAQALDFNVSFDGAKNTIAIDTSKPYTP